MSATDITPLMPRHPMQHIRDRILERDLVAPHAFIRALCSSYDRETLVDQWLRPLDTGDDFRFSVTQSDGTEHWILMERLPWDSQFFGWGVARLNSLFQPGEDLPLRGDVAAGIGALQASLNAARSNHINYVFCTVSPSDLPSLRILSACGFELIETRCYYHRSLVVAPVQRYPTRVAVSADVPSLASAARVMINPFDRFHADIAIPEEAADRLMERWVQASITGGFADVTIVPDVEAPEAFCTAKYHREHWSGWGLKLAQPVFSAVAPRHKGWYVKIISELDEHLRSIGAEHSFLITQITNIAVLHSWEKLGYRFGKGEYIFRKLL